MKKAKQGLVIILIGIVFLAAFPFMTGAASASASLSGSATARAGDTIEIKLNINGSGILGVDGRVKYDASKLTLKSAIKSIGGSWVVTFNPSSGTVGFVAYDSAQTSPINSSKTLITMVFTLNSSVSANDSITISTQGLQASSGEEAISIANRNHTITVLAPLSAENNLSSLVVSNAALSPAFNENVTRYSVGTVPFSVSKLDIKAIAKDSRATVTISGNSLSVGSNSVNITVKAESGATKIYTISVIREQDPNYVKESNAAVANITIDNFLISPPFNKTTTSYVVWLPYETTSITVSAQSESDKARVVIEGGNNLQEGNNEIKIICTAEDGTVQIYLLVAIRATKDGSVVAPYTPPTEPDPTDKADYNLKDLMIYALMPVLLVGGFGSGYAVKSARKKKVRAKRHDDTEEPPAPPPSLEEITKPKRTNRKNTDAVSDFATFSFSPSAPAISPPFSETYSAIGAAPHAPSFDESATIELTEVISSNIPPQSESLAAAPVDAEGISSNASYSKPPVSNPLPAADDSPNILNYGDPATPSAAQTAVKSGRIPAAASEEKYHYDSFPVTSQELNMAELSRDMASQFAEILGGGITPTRPAVGATDTAASIAANRELGKNNRYKHITEINAGLPQREPMADALPSARMGNISTDANRLHIQDATATSDTLDELKTTVPEPTDNYNYDAFG